MPVGPTARLVYAAGNYGKAILFGTLEFALLFVMTDLLGLPSAIAGAFILVSLLVDALLDGLVGYLADRARLPVGRYWPFVAIGAPLASGSFLLFAALPLSKAPDVVLIMVTLLVFRIGYAVMDVPHNSLIGLVAPSSRDRADLAGVRFVFSSAASLTLAFMVGPLARDAGAREAITPERLFAFAVFAAATSLVTMLGACVAVWKADRDTARTAPHSASLAVSVRAGIASRPYRIALASGALTALLLPLHAKSHLYIAKYILDDPTFAGALLGTMISAQLASAPLWLWAMPRLEKAQAMQAAHLLCALGMIVGLLTVQGCRAGLLVGEAIYGIGHFGVLSLIWSMVADCVDEARARTGVQIEGLMFAVAIMSQKAAFGLAIGAYGMALSFVGFQAHHIADARTVGVFVTFGFALPAIGSLASIALMRGYRLTHATHAALRG